MAHHTEMVLAPPLTSVLIGSLSYNTPDVHCTEQVHLDHSEHASSRTETSKGLPWAVGSDLNRSPLLKGFLLLFVIETPGADPVPSQAESLGCVNHQTGLYHCRQNL